MSKAAPTNRLMTIGALLWLASALLYLGCEAAAASAVGPYDYARDYISDLGSPDRGPFLGRHLGSPLHSLMNLGFIGRGLLFFAGSLPIAACMARPSRGAFLSLAFVQSLGVILVGLVPVGPTSSARHLLPLHLWGAVLAIVGGNLFWIWVGLSGRPTGRSPRFGRATWLVGLVGLLAFVMLAANIVSGQAILFADGLWERISVYTVIGWTAVYAWLLLARPPQSSAGMKAGFQATSHKWPSGSEK